MYLIPLNCVKKVITRHINEEYLDVSTLQERLDQFPFDHGIVISL